MASKFVCSFSLAKERSMKNKATRANRIISVILKVFYKAFLLQLLKVLLNTSKTRYILFFFFFFWGGGGGGGLGLKDMIYFIISEM